MPLKALSQVYHRVTVITRPNCGASLARWLPLGPKPRSRFSQSIAL